jgi:uncharacterized protein DUF6184
MHGSTTEAIMPILSGRKVFVSVGFAIFVAACAHESEVSPGVATTTAAAVANDSAVVEVAKARCRRLDECNRLGGGQVFADRDQCVTAYMQPDANLKILRACPDGVDRARLDVCLATLADQHCDANMGPVTAMTDCASYCARVAPILE